MTALHYAAIYGYSAVGRILLGRGANPAEPDKLNHDPAWYSGWYGNSEMLALFAAKPGQPGKGKTVTKALSPGIKDGKAVVHFLNHSGYAIETSKHLLVFDYVPNNLSPDQPSLLNGKINPGELKDKKIMVFVSHEHSDHYDTVIWSWHSLNPGISYIMGFDPHVNYKYVLLEPRSDKTLQGVRIHTIRSTDSGAGFLVEAEGVVIYHPGDHVNKSDSLSPDYKNEIDFLAGLGKKVDIAFFPVNGCAFPDPEGVKLGNLYAIEKLKPVLCFAMHADTEQCRGFAETIMQKYTSIRADFGTFPGDRFNFPE